MGGGYYECFHNRFYILYSKKMQPYLIKKKPYELYPWLLDNCKTDQVEYQTLLKSRNHQPNKRLL